MIFGAARRASAVCRLVDVLDPVEQEEDES